MTGDRSANEAGIITSSARGRLLTPCTADRDDHRQGNDAFAVTGQAAGPGGPGWSCGTPPCDLRQPRSTSPAGMFRK